jgi:hypothetical protein
MQRVYFICPNSEKEISATFDISDKQTPKGMFDVTCRQCGESHRFYGRDVQRSRIVKMPKQMRLSR